MTETKTILSLCDLTGAWPRPYAEDGYDVICFDIQHDPSQDVRLLRVDDLPPIHGVLAAPPCTHLSGSGARWWADKGDEALMEGLALVDACLRIVMVTRPVWWALENPVGRLSRFLGPARMTFQPWEFGDPYSKRTCLWGDFNTDLPKRPCLATDKERIWRMAPGPERANLRSVTPEGFARAFFEANR